MERLVVAGMLLFYGVIISLAALPLDTGPAHENDRISRVCVILAANAFLWIVIFPSVTFTYFERLQYRLDQFTGDEDSKGHTLRICIARPIGIIVNFGTLFFMMGGMCWMTTLTCQFLGLNKP